MPDAFAACTLDSLSQTPERVGVRSGVGPKVQVLSSNWRWSRLGCGGFPMVATEDVILENNWAFDGLRTETRLPLKMVSQAKVARGFYWIKVLFIWSSVGTNGNPHLLFDGKSAVYIFIDSRL